MHISDSSILLSGARWPREFSADMWGGPRTLEEMHAAFLARRAKERAVAPSPPPPPAPALPEPESPKPLTADDFAIAAATAKASLHKKIIAAIAAEYGVTVEEILGKRKTRAIAEARQRAIWMIWKASGEEAGHSSDGPRCAFRWSLPRIGRIFGRDHTTVLHAIRKMEGTAKKKSYYVPRTLPTV